MPITLAVVRCPSSTRHSQRLCKSPGRLRRSSTQICGFQHSLAMLAGLITPPIIFANELGFDAGIQNQMVAVSLIASGILSCVQMTRFAVRFLQAQIKADGLIRLSGRFLSQTESIGWGLA